MKLLFIYINPTGRTSFPPNISLLIGHIRRRRGYAIRVFDTSHYTFDFGQPSVEAAWTTGYFLPAKNQVRLEKRTTDLDTDLVEEVRSFRPDLIAVSAYSNQYFITQEILRHLKDHFPGIPNIVGGCHASFEPEEVIGDEFVDMICVGEGEETLLQLCDRIAGVGDLSSVPNLWYKSGGRVLRNPTGPPLPLDEVGPQDWSLFDPKHLYQPFHGRFFRSGMVEFGRGCPYPCTYCANQSYLNIYSADKRAYYRHHNPDRFVSWLREMKDRYALEMIYFQDGTFLTMPDEVLEELAERYQREIGLPCLLLTTVNTVTAKRLRLLKRMNCVYMNIGIESGNAEFRKNVLKRRQSNERIAEAFRLVREHGIHAASYNVIGFPSETRENIFETIELNRKCRPDSVYTQIFYPIAGSELYHLCLKEGFFDRKNESRYGLIHHLGSVSVLEGLPLSRRELHGLLSTVYLYIRMPKVFYPLIRLMEKQGPLSRAVISGLTQFYWSREPHFRNGFPPPSPTTMPPFESVPEPAETARRA